MTDPIEVDSFLRGDAEVAMVVTRLAMRAEAAGLEDREVAGVLGIDAPRWARAKGGVPVHLSRSEERGVRLLGDLLGYAGLLLGDDLAVSAWLRSRCEPLGEWPLARLIRDPSALGWMCRQLEREHLEGGAP